MGPWSGRWPGPVRAAKVAGRGDARLGRWSLGPCGPSPRRGVVGWGRDQFNAPPGHWPGAVVCRKRSAFSWRFFAVVLGAEKTARHGATLGCVLGESSGSLGCEANRGAGQFQLPDWGSKQLVEGATGVRGFLLGCRLDARRVVLGHPVEQFVKGKTWRRLGCRRVRATRRCGLGRWRGSNWLSQLVLRRGLVGGQSWRNLGRRGGGSRCRGVAWVQWVVPTGFGG